MDTLVSSLFHVICFPHEGRIVTIDQISFFGPNVTSSLPSSLPSPYLSVISSLPQVNYVATYSMSASADDSVNEVVQNVMGHWVLTSKVLFSRRMRNSLNP